jgi:hypothetical protein
VRKEDTMETCEYNCHEFADNDSKCDSCIETSSEKDDKVEAAHFRRKERLAKRNER